MLVGKTAQPLIGETPLLVKNLLFTTQNLQLCQIVFREIPWARLQAMASSLETEMPTATGVFPPTMNQPYMPADIERKLAEVTKVRNAF